MKPMRITIVIPNIGLDGGLRVAALYAERLTARGHHVVLAARRQRPLRKSHVARKLLAGRGVWRRWADPTHFDRIDCDLQIVTEFRPIDDRDLPDADVVVATWWETAEWVSHLSPSKGKPVYFLQGYDAGSGQPADRVDATWRLPMQKITVAQWLADKARDEFNDPNAIIVPNGVDTTLFNAPPRHAKPATPTIGFVYHDLPIKGCDLIFGALEQLRSKHHNLRVRSFGLIGSTPRLPIPNWVEHNVCPKHTRIVDLYSSCTAWAWGSRQEGFGLPILEAMACRTPVVATSAGAAPDLLASGEGGLLVPADDANALADGLHEILSLNDNEWTRSSEQARAIAERHNWDRAVELFEGALRRVADA